ncbi:MAG TPA: thermonuclease family protein, partial [Chitinophagaceae bacterium]|nr:thermonuclease family protein [Chitinophagaceae bacterium]
MKTVFIFLFLLSVLSCSNSDKKLQNKVVGITDGDTFTLLTDENKQIKIRLHGIDCPEKAQDFGTVARQKLSDLIFNEPLRIEKKDVDRYGRTVALVYKNGVCINEEMLKAGLAWHYKEYDKNPAWDVLEETARKNKRGLW